ncbi:hypothetical protein GQR58_030091 [Nymphon striatum]|nr:hypothetical protein GQR58_030091 [Nymphon striatum]
MGLMTITMYGADWCGDCRRAKAWFDEREIAYTYVDPGRRSRRDRTSARAQQRGEEDPGDRSVWDDPIDGPDAGNSVCTDRAVPCPPVLAAVPGKERGDGKILQRNPSAVVTTAEMYLSLELAAEHVRDTGRALRDQQCVDDVGAVVVVDVARIGVDAHGVVAQRAGAAVLADAGTELCDHEGVGDVDGDAAIHVARELGANQAADGVAGQLRRRLGEALLDGECERCGVEHVAGRDVYGQQLGGCGPTRRGHGLEDDQTRCGLGAGHPCCAGRARGEFDQGWIEADRGTYGRSGGRAR